MKRTQTTPKENEVKTVEAKKKNKSMTKASPKKKVEKIIDIDEVDQDETESSDTFGSSTLPAFTPMRKVLLGVLILGILGYLGYKYSYYFVPASVNGKPIYAWEYMSTLHNQYGKEHLQTLTTQKVIEQAIESSKVTVASDAIDKEIDTIDKQASSSGGVSALLTAQNLTMEQLREQVRIQLAVKEILKDKIQVSDAEIDDTFKKNKEFFKGKSEADAKAEVKEQLEAQKFQKEASAWVGEIRNNAKVTISFPGMDAQ